MASKTRLVGYDSIAVVDESNQTFGESNESWVQANVILPSKLVDASTKNVSEGQQIIETEEVTPVYRDKWFAVLFIAHLITFVTVGSFYGAWPTFDDNDNNGSMSNGMSKKIDTTMLTIFVSGSAVVAFLVTYFTTALILPRYPTRVVEASLLESVLMYIAMGIMIVFTFPNIWGFIVAAAIIFFSFWYVRAMWEFIPFAAANLKLASQAVSANFGMYFISFLTGSLGFGWLTFWTYTANGVGLFTPPDDSITTNTDDYYDSPISDAASLLKVFSLLLSLYWTTTVLVNITQTTTAGITGTWCFDKSNASSCCSSAVTESLTRSCKYSFGSICFGSLLQALVTTLRVMLQSAQDNARNDGNSGAALLFCILACIISMLEDIIEYFNEWAFVFVGIYGTDYLESGKRVMELFSARGVTAILSNRLAVYVLMNVVLCSSLSCGLFGYIVGGNAAAFWICFIVGLIVSMTMTSIVLGAVKSVIVCYADHPSRLYENHPVETQQLSDAISLIYRGVPVPVFNNVIV